MYYEVHINVLIITLRIICVSFPVTGHIINCYQNQLFQASP